MTLLTKNGKVYPDKHDIQSMLYSALGSSRYGENHDRPSFKYFTYSDFFYDKKERGTLVVSSPYPRLVDTIFEWAKNQDFIQLGSLSFEIQKVQVIKPRLNNEFTSGSPIVLYLDSASGEYFSLREHGDITFFLDRMKDNALKKYEFFNGTELHLEGPLFDAVELRREVAVPVRIRGYNLTFIGSLWKSLVKDDIEENADFYQFLMETGLGEKNSLGFGFINPVGSGQS
ncbi:MAG: CRISPR-associated endoribonuclease Cas6 [Candidatus Thorarchaeota archaeon]|nr:CRISPR-associated endoribonuclease Cas6 [Candidatus Thorarchaeota archaeon]